ncbi:MAG TPA: fused MFS/spermidine synthase, partial [Acidobacteriota bacterium]|nr:fused MFS/spermidine synthase [Acidobacteriota bacterium]
MSSRFRTILYFFFFGSGFAALLYQAVWLKYLGLLFGNTTFATAAVLSAFMSGLSLGSWAAPKSGILFRNSLRSYGLIEAGIGCFAAFFPALYTASKIPFAWLFNLIGPQNFWYTVITFAVAFIVLVIPTSLMGASLPVLAPLVVGKEEVAHRTGVLYAVNTAGAVAGILCSAFVLIPALGLHATIYAGVLINLLVGLACFLWSGSAMELQREPAAQRPQNPLTRLYMISGLLALGYEVLWTRILVLHLGSSVHAYAIMLAIFLLGISLGSASIGRWAEKSGWRPEHVFACLQVAWAFSILLQVVEFRWFSDILYALTAPFVRLNYAEFVLVLFAGAFLVLFLPTFLSGALFPVVVKSLWQQGAPIEHASSAAYSTNTIGGIFGSIIAAFVLIPVAGTQNALLIFAVMNLLLGWLASAGAMTPGFRKSLLLLTVAFVGCGLFLNREIQILRSAGIFRAEGKDELVRLEEDSASTISVEKRMYLNRPYLSLSVNGVNVAGSSPQLVSIQKMQGNLPMMLYGAGKPASVLHIGFGSGGTAYSVSLYPESQITVVELSRAIVRNADTSFRSENHGIVQSGRLKMIYFDGRSFLQNTSQTFDLILSDSIHPRYSGNGSLYTRDYYELVNAHLNPGGVHSQWIPTYSLSTKNLKEILRAFWEVFPETYVWYVNSTINPYIVI